MFSTTVYNKDLANAQKHFKMNTRGQTISFAGQYQNDQQIQTEGEDDEAQLAFNGKKSQFDKDNYELTSDYNETLKSPQNIDSI